MKKSGSSRYVLGTLVIVAAFVALVASSMKSTTLRAVPVDQVRAADNTAKSFVGRRLRIVGFVSHQPVKRVPQQTPHGTIEVAHFSIEEKGKLVNVAFRDALPDTFRAGGPVQVDGTYAAPGSIEAEHVLTKCPSKYEEAKPAPGKKDGAKPYGDKPYGEKTGAEKSAQSTPENKDVSL